MCQPDCGDPATNRRMTPELGGKDERIRYQREWRPAGRLARRLQEDRVGCCALQEEGRMARETVERWVRSTAGGVPCTDCGKTSRWVLMRFVVLDDGDHDPVECLKYSCGGH